MISVYGLSETAFDHNGEAVLCPTKAAVKMVAGGEYSFTMEHPMDPWGKWKKLKREAVVRLPVPAETIDAASVGYDTDVYEITTKADLREEPREPTVIYYTPWVAGTSYAVGAKVSYSNKNYRCEYMDPSSGFLWMTPDTSSWWKQIPRMTAGAAVLSTLKAGTEVYLLEESGDWYKVMTKYGLTGYVKKTQATYKRHITPADLAPREITEQLFRIKEVSVDRKSGVVSVSGNHVSNDLNGTLVERVTLTDAPPAMAIGMIAEGLMGDYRGDIATNLYGDDVTITYTADIKRKNGMFCLTDPDTGVVPKMNAKFTRDNWDLFIMKRSAVLADLRIAYGKNTDGIIWKEKSDSLVTRVVPVAKDEKGEDLYLDADGESAKWVDSTHIGDYPVIYMEALNVKGQVGKETEEGSGTNWTLTTLLEEMRTKAQERFTVDGADIPETELTVQLEQLSSTAEYARLRGLDGAVLYDIVTVHDPDIGLSLNLAVSEIEYDCVAGRITGIKLVTNLYGKDRSVTGFNVVNKSITGVKLADEVTEGIMNEVRGIIPEYADPNASRPVSVTDNDVTLAYGERSTIGAIQGTELHVTMPAAASFDPNSLSEDTADINDNTLFLQVGSTSYKKKFGKVWDYIKGKISSVLGLSENGYTGNAATATNADKLDGKHAADFIPATAKGANNGVAELDSGGKVPQSQLPSYVDDVLEYNSLSDFPATGEAGKIYVALDTNKTYRWSGSAYVEISPSLALGETSSTAYRGDRGKTAYDHASAKGSAYASGLYKVTTNSEGHITAATAVQKSDITALGIPGSDTTYSPGTGLSLVGTTFSVKTGYTGSGKNYPVLADESGNLYVAVPWENNTYSPGTGLSLSNGTFAVKLGYTSSGKNYKVEADSSGNLYVNVPWTDTTYSLPLAANGTRGGVQVGYAQSGKNYPVQLDNEKMYVNVPWENTDHQYTAGTGLQLSNGEFTVTDRTLTDRNVSASCADCNAVTDAGMYRIISTTANRPFAYGVLIHLKSNNYITQIAVDVVTGELWFRGKASGTWSEWTRALAPNGTGASGTWGISITGNAATATELPTPTEVEDSCLGNASTFKVFKSTTTAPGNDGFILGMKWSSSGNYAAQLYIDTDPTYSMALRQQKTDGTWKAWKQIPMGDGTGASGTWPISITGNADTVDSKHAKDFLYNVRYGTTDTTTKLKININSTERWMLCFVVTLYQNYRATKVMISGYQYHANYWYQPEARILGDSNNDESIDVYFGYDSEDHLWVGFDGNSYTGVAITDVVNGFMQIDDYDGLFTISNVSSLSTLQTTVTAHSYAYYANTAPWSGISDKPATATRWPSWSEVTSKPNRAGANSDGGDAINSDKVDNYHASDLAKTKYLGWGATLEIPSTHAEILFNYSHRLQVWLGGSGTALSPYGICVGMTYFKDTGISGYRKTLWDNSVLTLNLGDEYDSSSTRFRITRASDNKSFTFTSNIDGFATNGTITAFYH